MDNDVVVSTPEELSTKHQVAVVVLGAVAGYVASKLVGAGYTAGLNKVRTIRANRS